MGYTHYWNIKQPLEPEKFKAFAEDVKKIKSATSVKCGIVANQYEVVVNGPCESLVIQLNDSGFDFCKTNRYDYDVVVTATLLLAKRHFADAILLSSDGGETGFAMAKPLYEKITGEEFTGRATETGGVLSEEELYHMANTGRG